MDVVANMLHSMTATKGYQSADITQCGDHCDEVVNPVPKESTAEEHESEEKEEVKELKEGEGQDRRRL
jgi:hypothetical protein